MSRNINNARVSLVIPLFNEQECVAKLIHEVEKVMGEVPCASYEIVLIDGAPKSRETAHLRSWASWLLAIDPSSVLAFPGMWAIRTP